ncbi:MAG: type I restriction endonuclease [Candidatus Methylumidiphilus sp.]
MSIDKIKIAAEQIPNRLPAVKGKGEEATKQALVLPMLAALGYDIWNPAEVCPEYDADFAIKKAGQKEKVDIAILLLSYPRVYMEVKSADTILDGHEGQVARYFNSTSTVTLGILTNGIEWRFYTDTANPNVMDSQPFHIVRLDAADQGLDVLVRFSRQFFSPEAIRDFATELLYTANIAAFLRSEIDLREKDPSEYFIRWILKSEKMYDGVVNQNVIERFRPIVKAGLTRVIREVVRRSVIAMDVEAARNEFNEPIPSADSVLGIDAEKSAVAVDDAIDLSKSAILTTDRELALFGIAKDIFEKSSFASSTIFDASTRKDTTISIAYKDTTGYFGVYFNKPSWWILRAVTEAKKPWIGFNIPVDLGLSVLPSSFVRLDPSPFAEFRVAISAPEDLKKLEAVLLASFEQAILMRSSQTS